MAKQAGNLLKNPPSDVDRVPGSKPAATASSNRGVLVTLSGFFFYAIFLQLSTSTSRNINANSGIGIGIASSNGAFRFIDLSTRSVSRHTEMFEDAVPVVDTSFTSSRRILAFQDDILHNDNNNVDPINPKNKICRDYLKKFIEGSTDSKDECEGLENAYSDADCSDDINNRNLMTISTFRDESSSPTASPNSDSSGDDKVVPAIDDFFEEFQCCKVISRYYSSRCLYHQQFASLSLLGIVAVLILCNLVKSLLNMYGIHWLPEAGGCILVGAAVGAAMTWKLPSYQMICKSFYCILECEELYLSHWQKTSLYSML